MAPTRNDLAVPVNDSVCLTPADVLSVALAVCPRKGAITNARDSAPTTACRTRLVLWTGIGFAPRLELRSRRLLGKRACFDAVADRLDLGRFGLGPCLLCVGELGRALLAVLCACSDVTENSAAPASVAKATAVRIEKIRIGEIRIEVRSMWE